MFRMVRNVGFVVLLVCVWYVYCNNKNEKEEESSEIFIPTTEWQVVKKGQKIPQGLHVRMNFETGITEAKLLDQNEKSQNKEQALLEIPQNKPENILESSRLFKTSQLKEAMKNIKGDDIINPDELKTITKKFRKYEDLKKDLHGINLTPKTDSELLAELIDKLKNPEAYEIKNKLEITLKLLDDLDFLVHQIDNGIEFIRQNGLKDIIYENLNSTDVLIKRDSLKLLSSLTQNNPQVKIHAIETGSIGILLRLISLDTDDVVKLRAVTALSCILRRFPFAQLKFIENGGLTVVGKVFESKNIKIKLKFATLIGDLLVEQEESKIEGNVDELKQYKLLGLQKLLTENNWCENLNDLLENLVVIDINDHDSIEKCLISIKSIIRYCSTTFSKNVLHKLEKRYVNLAVIDSDKEEDSSNSAYFNDLTDLCKEILQYSTRDKTEL